MTKDVMNLEIVDRTEQADGIVVIELRDAAGVDLPPFEPGAHVDVHVGQGLVRQYSLAGNPSDRTRYRLGILLDPASRGGSAGIHRTFRKGDSVRISSPKNNFPLAKDAVHSVLIGGGIGITPVLAMAHSLIDGDRSFELHYCARDRRKAAFLAELAEEAFAARTRLHFDDGPPEQRLDLDTLPEPTPGTHLYVCGPTGFMDWVIKGARDAGYPEAQIHREYFKAEVDTSGGSFDVVLSESGKTVTVPGGVSIVKALAGAGIKVEVSCENGVCGTCLCNVLEGEPDHRDTYLTDDEKQANDQMLLCCSRAKTPQLVLEL